MRASIRETVAKLIGAVTFAQRTESNLIVSL